MATNVSEKEARDVVEAAREAEWKLPSFGKQLFLGDFRLDLIHPQPQLDPQAIEKGERFLGELRAVLAERADPLEIEREAQIPDRVVDGLKSIGALGMKVPPEYGGLGLSQLYYSKALASQATVTRRSARSSAHTSRSASPSRCGCSAARNNGASGCRWSPRTTSARFS